VTRVKGSIRIGQVRGVKLRTHWSVPVLLLLFAYGLSTRTLPAWAPGRSSVVYVVAGVAGALLLVASLVAHEAAHALTARRAGIPVHDMTLWALGGVTRMERPRTARDAFTVAISGPIASLLVAGAALGVAAGTRAVLGWDIPVGILVWLGGINVLVGAFNLLPAAPLDGGRVLQAAVWWRTGDQERAERTAGRGGQIVGTLLIAGGLLATLARGAVGGLWIALIGLFISFTAGAERQRAVLHTALRGVRVSDALTGPVSAVPDWWTVDRLLTERSTGAADTTLPLVDFDGRPSGVLEIRRLGAVPVGRRDTVRLRDLATPASRCVRAVPDEMLDTVLDRVRPGTGLPVLVVEDDHLAGIVTGRDISRIVQRHRPSSAPSR
jgi:Zn-dependent protease